MPRHSPRHLRRVRRAGALAALLFALGCGAEALIEPIIILTNTWAEEGNPDHTFQFNDDTGGEPREEGTFTGTETLPDGTQYEFQGSWDEGWVEFTVDRAAHVTYRGRITQDNANRIEYTSSAGDLVLVR